MLRARAQVVQEIKVLRSSVSQREKEKAERATLVEQERLVKAKARVPLQPLRVHGTALGAYCHACIPRLPVQGQGMWHSYQPIKTLDSGVPRAFASASPLLLCVRLRLLHAMVAQLP